MGAQSFRYNKARAILREAGNKPRLKWNLTREIKLWIIWALMVNICKTSKAWKLTRNLIFNNECVNWRPKSRYTGDQTANTRTNILNYMECGASNEDRCKHYAFQYSRLLALAFHTDVAW